MYYIIYYFFVKRFFSFDYKNIIITKQHGFLGVYRHVNKNPTTEKLLPIQGVSRRPIFEYWFMGITSYDNIKENIVTFLL